MRFALALVLAVAIAPSAQAQVYDWSFSDHNRDRGWANSAFQEQHGPRVKGTPRYRPGGDRHRRRHAKRKPVIVAQPDPEVRGWHREDRHPGTSRRDATAAVMCWPHVEAWSVEANTEDGAWRDAQRNWEAQVRAMYGERWLEVGNALNVERQCWVSSGNQSVAGRVAENVARVVGSETLDGRKHRCRIMARPCQAPKQFDPATKATKQ